MEDNKKKDESPEQRRPEENGEGGGMPRFNFMWVFILIGLGLLALQFTKFSGKPENASWTDRKSVV